jgi:hypothetical protein
MNFPQTLRQVQKGRAVRSVTEVGFRFRDYNFKDSQPFNFNTLQRTEKCSIRHSLRVINFFNRISRANSRTFPIEGLALGGLLTLVCAGLEIREYGRGDPLR